VQSRTARVSLLCYVSLLACSAVLSLRGVVAEWPSCPGSRLQGAFHKVLLALCWADRLGLQFVMLIQSSTDLGVMQQLLMSCE
jgi:hypothetical protein